MKAKLREAWTTFNTNYHFRRGFCRGLIVCFGVGSVILFALTPSVPNVLPIAAINAAGSLTFWAIFRWEFRTWRFWTWQDKPEDY